MATITTSSNSTSCSIITMRAVAMSTRTTMGAAMSTVILRCWQP